MKYSTNNNEAAVELITENNGTRKWCYYHRIKVIGVTFIVLTLSAITMSLLLQYVIFAPREPETTTILTTTTITPVTTTISTSTITMTTTQQSGKL